MRARTIDVDGFHQHLLDNYCDFCECDGCDECLLHKAMIELENYAQAHTELPWISCEDRLPLLHQEVIVAVYGSDIIVPNEGEDIIDAVNRSMDTHRNVTVGCLGSDGWYGADGFPMVVSPKFWMPKPELPKEVQQDD